MLFNSFSFLIFFLIVFFAYWKLKSNASRHLCLLSASYFFYAYWDYRFLGLILLVTFVAYTSTLGISNAKDNSTRKRILWISILLYLSVLFFFKYFNFFIESFTSFSEAIGLKVNTTSLNIILPVGISFYTFQAISYTVDVYRRNLSPDNSFIEVALYIAFFPQLVAGPIVRATDFLPQLKCYLHLRREQLYKGIRFFLIGYFYKVVAADNLAAIADPVFSDPSHWDGTAYWVALLAYYGQIYFDFAGYSGMAIGIAFLLGFKLPVNFNYPYSAETITDFWRRWHISLSTWLRDYLYIPLGGNRRGRLNTYKNLMITMILGGLWHGASWNFVVWGTMHGFALAVHKYWLEIPRRQYNVLPTTVTRAATLISTQIWVLFAWLFFRSENFENSTTMLWGMLGFVDASATNSYSPVLLLLVTIPVIVDAIAGRYATDKQLQIRVPATVYAIFVGVVLAGFLWLQPLNLSPFIYFQF